MARKEAVRQSNLSEEIIHDSSDEEDQTVQPRTKTKTKTKKASQTKPASPSTTTTSDDEDLEESSSSQSSVEEEADSDSEAASSSSSSSSKKRSSDTVSETPVKKARKTAESSEVRLAPKAYKAPSGYEALALSPSDYTSGAATLFDNLEGKQIWHISVPDSISIKSIKSFDMQTAMRGESILSKDGVNYNLHDMPFTRGSETILMPQGTKPTYRHSATIQKNFQLREMGDKVNTSDKKGQTKASSSGSSSTDGETAENEQELPPTSLVFTATKTGKAKEIRQQPEGLKMRYFPYGSTATSEVSEDVEMADAFQVPDEIPEPSQKKKSKKSRADSQGSVDGEKTNPEKKKKKKRRLVDADVL
ncbi:hypothetical protein PV08_10308 [Exophiala spinifera]|uniref:DNA-directed RNA polymerase I subunit RPA34.5 n=1 Tax=Exophiala spinifera TaxID=91928 RepID=A0A0D2BI56_9EURO|nr:uncharacterized protein PV08_10308 [Exophiala spinifera]KIW11009.1 hypothetical protein PV08_10308 [Exophiala spinifera]